jgi:hypothetical protein
MALGTGSATRTRSGSGARWRNGIVLRLRQPHHPRSLP